MKIRVQKAIQLKTAFKEPGLSGQWQKGVDGWAYDLFIGDFPHYTLVATYHQGGKIFIKDYCPDFLKDFLMDKWSIMNR